MRGLLLDEIQICSILSGWEGEVKDPEGRYLDHKSVKGVGTKEESKEVYNVDKMLQIRVFWNNLSG